MIKRFILLLSIIFLPLIISGQSIRITDKKVQRVIDEMEMYSVELIEVKTLRKWKALELSSDMRPQMDYNVIRVKYRTGDMVKTVLIDMHLVPILYSSQRTIDKTERKNNYVAMSD
jgi:hypothetical protein